MSDHQGSCFCGAVAFTVSGEPAAMGYCHCESCRHWSGGPVNAFTLWPASALRVTRGADLIGTYTKTPMSLRKWCTLCGGHGAADLVAVVCTCEPGFSGRACETAGGAQTDASIH